MSKVEVITSVERRRKWSDEDKESIVKESFEFGVTVTAKKYKIEPNQIYVWRREINKGVLQASGVQLNTDVENTLTTMSKEISRLTEKLSVRDQYISKLVIERFERGLDH